MERLLSPRALREPLPTAQQLLQHELFKGLNAEDIQARQLFKLSGQMKETLRVITSKIEERLRHDQKIVRIAMRFDLKVIYFLKYTIITIILVLKVHHQRRLARVQEMLGSEEEKKRKKQKWVRKHYWKFS